MKKSLLVLSILLLAGSLFPVRAAETAEDTIRLNLDEVVVVEFYRTDLRRGNLLNHDQIQRNNRGQEPSFILSNMPSIFAYSDTGNEYGYSYFRMRGMDQTRVNMTLDGMPLNEGEDMGVYFSNYPDMVASMHSIKVENGANISNNGVAAYAGSIDFESVDLERDTVSSAYAGYGSFNTFKSSVEYNTGRRGKFAGHFKATQQQSDGFREHAYNNSQSAFVKLGWFINERHTIDLLSFVGQSRNGQGWIGSTAEELAIDRSANGCSADETDRFVQNINKLQYRGRLGERTAITASLYYNYLKGHYYFDVDNYMWKVVDPAWLPTGEIDCYHLRHHMLGGNATARFYGRAWKVTTGVNVSTFDRHHVGTDNLSTDELWNNKGYKNDLTCFVKGEYTYRGLTAGLHLQYRHADFDYKGDVPFRKVNWNFLNGSAHLRWRFNGSHSVYVRVAQTHREPTRSDMFGGEENLTELVTTQAESVIDYEAGYNICLGGLSGNVNLYYMDFHNELILNGEMGTNGLPIRVNAAKSYRAGVELSLNYEPVTGLRLGNVTSFSTNRVETDDEKLEHVLSPKWLVKQTVAYAFRGFEVGVELRYRSRMFFDLTNRYALGASVRLNAFARYTFRRLTVGLYGNNLFNERSYSNGMLGASGPLYFVDVPRNFFVDARWKF